VKKRLEIELFEEHENVNFYTLRFNNEPSEFDKFLDKFPKGCPFDEDIDIIVLDRQDWTKGRFGEIFQNRRENE
jgi:hypothetical protein